MKMINTHKQRIYRLVFHLVMLACILLPQLLFIRNLGSEFISTRIILSMTMIVVIHFIHISFMIPYLLKRDSILKYTMLVGATLVAYAFVVYYSFDLRNDEMVLIRNGEVIRTFQPIPIPPIIMAAIVMLIGLAFELIMEREKRMRKQLQAEQEMMEVELRLLRSQINPHFFFNTLHNIYSLVVCKSNQAEDALLLLSDLMRYVLYENLNGKIKLDKEISFIENYIALQELRADDIHKPSISFEKQELIKDYKIEPMLLIPFIENAFKYAKHSPKSHVNIHLKAINNTLIFNIMNSIRRDINPVNKTFSGLGIANIKKRLDILYPNKHDLIINDNGETFQVELSLIMI